MEADGGDKGSMWPMVHVVHYGWKVLGTGAGYIVSAVGKQRMRGVWDQVASFFFFMGFGTQALGIGLPYSGEASCKLPNQDNYSQV